MRYARSLFAVLAAVSIACCSSDVAAATPPPASPSVACPVGGPYALSCCGVTYSGDETAKVQACFNQAAVWGGEVNFEGRPITVSSTLLWPATPMYIGQVQGLGIRNCLGGITITGDQSLFDVAPGTVAYFPSITDCKLLAPGITTPQRPVVNFTRMSNFTFHRVWVFGSPASASFSATGNPPSSPYYGTFDQIYGAGGWCIVASATAGAYTAPNSNTIRGSRFQCATGVWIGEFAQNWTFGDGNACEGATTCYQLDGTGVVVRAGQRFEGAANAVGILLGPRSDGLIEGQQTWSIGSNATAGGARIKASPGLDLASWTIYPQPVNK